MKKLVLLMFVSLFTNAVIAQQQSIIINDNSKTILIADKIIGSSFIVSADKITTVSLIEKTNVSGQCIVTFDDSTIAEAAVKCINDNGEDIFKARLTENDVFEFIYTPSGSENAIIGRGNVKFQFPNESTFKTIFENIIACDPIGSITMNCN